VDVQRARVGWVATPPPGAPPYTRPRRLRYLGPPSYASPPRWGFPPLAWRWPTSVAGTPVRPPVSVERVRAAGNYASTLLAVLTTIMLFAAGTEIWRYVLLVRSRTGALPRATVNTSDALVLAGSIFAITVALFALVLTVFWLALARSVAADLAGHEPARPDWQVLLGLVVPGLNLVVPGSVLAELEHTVLRRPLEKRPRPSRLILSWWIAWALSGLLCLATVLWRLRSGVQAEADGVLLTALTYVAAAVVAVLTLRVIRRLTTLLVPIDPASVRLMHVIKVDGAPNPPLRPGRPAGSTR
jgi:Domain of unknown function (DUF4328)